MSEVTRILSAIEQGDPSAAGQLLPLVYDELRKMAAQRLAMEKPEATGHAINVGSGQQFSVLDIADRMARVLDKESIPPQVSRRYRAGDIRHCFADISLARKLLGYEPQVAFENGLSELANWLGNQIAVDRFSDANAQLAVRGLTI